MRYDHEHVSENNSNIYGILKIEKDNNEDDINEQIQLEKTHSSEQLVSEKTKKTIFEMINGFKFDKIKSNEPVEEHNKEDYQIEYLDDSEEEFQTFANEYTSIDESLEKVNIQLSNPKTEEKKFHVQENIPEFRELCPHCGFVSTSKNQCMYHLRKHKPKKTEENICSICNKTFREKITLSKHMIIHTTPPQIPCKICGKLLRTEQVLAQHMKVHSKIYSFKCNICGELRATQFELKTHMRFHTGERPFKVIN